MRNYLTVIGGAPWLPTTPTGLILWADPSVTSTVTPASITDGTAITGINDQSTVANNLAQSTGVYQPIWKSAIRNGLGVARFDGNNDFLLKSMSPTTQSSFTVFTVCYSSVNTAFNTLVTASTYPTHQLTLEIGATNSLNIWDAGVGIKAGTGNNTFALNTWHIVCWTYTSGTNNIYIDNVLRGTDTNTGGFLKCDNFWIGADFTSFYSWKGDIGTVLVYDNVLSAANQTAAYNYLKARWGL